MSDLQVYTPQQLGSYTGQTRGERSREWLELFFETAKAAEVLARTDFVPPEMKGKPAQVAAAIMKGYELDIDPLDALANIYSVNGRIGFYAEFMRRRIIQSGHEVKVGEASDTRAVMLGRRKGNEEWERAMFTAGQARAANIKLGSYPEDKLIARATSRLCKRTFPDVLSGAAIAEDLMDEQASGVSTAAPSVREEPEHEPGMLQRRRPPRGGGAETSSPATEPALKLLPDSNSPGADESAEDPS